MKHDFNHLFYVHVEFFNGYIFKTPFFFEVCNYWESLEGKGKVKRVWVDD